MLNFSLPFLLLHLNVQEQLQKEYARRSKVLLGRLADDKDTSPTPGQPDEQLSFLAQKEYLRRVKLLPEYGAVFFKGEVRYGFCLVVQPSLTSSLPLPAHSSLVKTRRTQAVAAPEHQSLRSG